MVYKRWNVYRSHLAVPVLVNWRSLIRSRLWSFELCQNTSRHCASNTGMFIHSGTKLLDVIEFNIIWSKGPLLSCFSSRWSFIFISTPFRQSRMYHLEVGSLFCLLVLALVILVVALRINYRLERGRCDSSKRRQLKK